MISPSLASECEWKVPYDTLGNDHIPIIITINEQITENDFVKDNIPKFNYKQADWCNFETILI